jgi:hypothetical protein
MTAKGHKANFQRLVQFATVEFASSIAAAIAALKAEKMI